MQYEPRHSAPPSDPPTLRIMRVAVEGLFGSLNHEIQLNPDARVTIIVGANGVGKTHVLEFVAALFGARLERLVAVPFSVLRVDLDDGSSVRVEQRSVELPPDEDRRTNRRMRKHKVRRNITIQLLREDVPASDAWEPSKKELRLRHEDERLPPWVVPLAFGHWWDEQAERVLTMRELRVLYGLQESSFDDAPSWFTTLLKQTAVQLIETQRLLRTHRRPRRPRQVSGVRYIDESDAAIQFTVRDLINDITEQIRLSRHRYHRKASVLDQTYVDRFLRYEVTATQAEPLQKTLDHIAERRARLESLSLLDADPNAASASRFTEVAAEKRLALSLFARDMDEKLAVLEPLAQQLELLLTTVNRKLDDTGKKLVTDSQDGLLIETRAGQRLDLENLSSGEQHELVLLYDLHFRVKQHSLVMIDEPELSLHPAWQQDFVDDLMSIAKLKQFDVMLATHSPYIVGERTALTVALGHGASQ